MYKLAKALVVVAAVVPALVAPQTVGADPSSGAVVRQAAATGLLRVTTSPAVPVRVSVDGTPRSDWATGPITVAAGTRRVCFSDVPGFTSPPCADVAVTAGATATTQGNYSRLGLLKVDTEPAGLPATIFVDGVPRDEFGLFAFIEPGSRRVCWGDVPQHQAPACATVTVTAGAQADVKGTFTPSANPTPGPAPSLGTVGFLRVATTPAVPSRIVVDGLPRTDFGLGPMEIPVGQHQVCFRDVPGYGTPPCQTVNVTQGATATVNGAFARLGLVKVDVTPPGLPVEVTVDGVPRDRFGLYTFIEPGTYTVCGTDTPNNATPACARVTVTGGQQANATLAYSASPPSGADTFLETFDGTPATPTNFSSTRWDIRSNIADYQKWGVGQSMDAQHGTDCSPPPATHQVGDWMSDGVFLCRDHMMTAVNADSYGLTMLTAAAQVDFSTSATVSFDVSTLMMSGRDWIDVWVSPSADFLTLACGGKCPAYNGSPRNAVHVEKDGPQWTVSLVKDFQTIASGQFSEVNPPSATVRTTFELRLTPTGVRFGTPADNRFTTVNGALGFTRGLVQWGHHSYNPFKDTSGVAATWHWDNIRIQPAVPMPFVKSTKEREIGRVGEVRTVTLAAPAPANSKVVFNAVCRIEIDAGSGFQMVPETPGSSPRGPETGHSYAFPLTAGTTSFQIRFQAHDWYAGFPCLFEHPVVIPR